MSLYLWVTENYRHYDALVSTATKKRRERQLQRLSFQMVIMMLALSNMWEASAFVELLERKGILTKQEVLDMIQELRRYEPTAIPPRRFET